MLLPPLPDGGRPGDFHAVSVPHIGTAQAALLTEAPAGKPFVADPRQAGALYDSGAARTAHAEPLNAAVGCAAEHGGRN
ncbi:hypothetical protein ACH4Q7_33450 [Streptomyces roseolus]|uniref:hypothetical protein n=1 Tax=Streptomyces roseolus TaxID=67358 RepID=UPI00379BC009